MSGTTNPDDTNPRRYTKVSGKLKVLPEQPEPFPVPTKRALLAPAQGGEGSNATGDSDDDDGDGGPDEDETEDVDVRFSFSLLVLLLWLNAARTCLTWRPQYPLPFCDALLAAQTGVQPDRANARGNRTSRCSASHEEESKVPSPRDGVRNRRVSAPALQVLRPPSLLHCPPCPLSPVTSWHGGASFFCLTYYTDGRAYVYTCVHVILLCIQVVSLRRPHEVLQRPPKRVSHESTPDR